MLKLYNTFSKNLEYIPKKDHINLYTCGPTVYNYAHIGNLRSYIMADLLYRTLKFNGYNTDWVMNITDIDDKTIKGTVEKYGADATVEDLKKYTDTYFRAFLKDLEEVNVSKDDIRFFKVTDVIPQIQDFIVKLIDKGYAYKADDGSAYFSIERYQKDFGDYGKLVGEKFLEGKKVGARVKVDEYEKDNLSDFALWKAWDKADAQIYWDHPVLGKGRPGWHIECSAINNIAFKGEPTDIHTGGVDLEFPHHTNEIAQSQALLGKDNFVHHWFHSEHLLVDGKKMAKRFNNFYTIHNLQEKGFSGMDFRYSMLGTSYRMQQNFTFESLLASHQALSKVDFSTGAILDKAKDLLNDDLNVAESLGILWKEKAGAELAENVLGIKVEMEDIAIPDAVDQLLKRRLQARASKDFQRSDDLRKQIEDQGYEVMDRPEGQKVRKKINI